jgi:hypothetical protein
MQAELESPFHHRLKHVAADLHQNGKSGREGTRTHDLTDVNLLFTLLGNGYGMG